MVPENKRELFMWTVLRYSVSWMVLLGLGAGPMEAADADQPRLPMEIRVSVDPGAAGGRTVRGC